MTKVDRVTTDVGRMQRVAVVKFGPNLQNLSYGIFKMLPVLTSGWIQNRRPTQLLSRTKRLPACL